MKQKMPHIVVTFHTTAEAMATERICKENQLEGKLISAPRTLSADCGIAWCGTLETSTQLRALLATENIEFIGMYKLEI